VHSDADAETSDASVPQAHAGVDSSDAGAPLTDADVDVNQGVENERDPELEVWDSDKGLKPAQLDSDASDDDCHRQIFGRETLSDLTAKSSVIEMKRGLRVLYDAYSQDSVAL
jgi:hypothetical protein